MRVFAEQLPIDHQEPGRMYPKEVVIRAARATQAIKSDDAQQREADRSVAELVEELNRDLAKA